MTIRPSRTLNLLLLLIATGCAHVAKAPGLRQPAFIRKSSAEAARRKSLQRMRREVLETVAGDIHPAEATPAQVPELDPNLPSPEEINACFRATCGPAESNWGVMRSGLRPGRDLTPAKIWESEFVPRIRRIAEHNFASQTKFLSSAQRVLKQNPPASMPEPFLNLVKLFQIAEILNADVFDMSKWPAEISLNNAALNAKLAAMPTKHEREMTSRFLNLALEVLYRHSAAATENVILNPIEVRLRREYPTIESSKALILDGLKLQGIWQRLEAKAPKEVANRLISSYLRGLILRAVNGSDFALAESASYIEAANFLEYFNATYLDQDFYKGLSAMKYDFAQDALQAKKSDWIKRFETWIQGHSVEENVKTISEWCRYKLEAALINTASPLRLAQAEKMIGEVKKAAIVVGHRYYAPNVENEIEDMFNQVKFVNPETREETYARLRYALDRTDESEKDNDETPDDRRIWARIAFAAKNNKPFDEDYDGLADFYRVCQGMEIQGMEDAALTFAKKIRLSWYAANYPEIGVGIVAHELAHVFYRNVQIFSAVDKAFAEKVAAGGEPVSRFAPFDNSLKCVSGRNPFFKPPTPDASGLIDIRAVLDTSSPWESEDWADHFSAEVLKELQRSHNTWASSVPVPCSFPNFENDQYAEKSVAPTEKTGHSADSLRLILTGADLGVLAKECQPAVSKLWKEKRVPLCE